MKKRIYLLLTLIASFFVFSCRVEAAKELTCICEDTGPGFHQMLVQNSNGDLFAYNNNKGNATIDDPEWFTYLDVQGYVGLDIKIEENGKYVDDELTSCPAYAYELSNPSVYDRETQTSTYKYVFSDTNPFFTTAHACTQYNFLPDLDIEPRFLKQKMEEYNEKVNNTKWSGVCTYLPNGEGWSGKIDLYFNEDEYLFINTSSMVETSILKFSLSDWWDLINQYEACPLYLYQHNPELFNSNIQYTWEYYLYSVDYNSAPSHVCEDVELDIEFEKEPVPEPIEDCHDLFGDELITKINDIMDIVKLVVPILLIFFGIVDFTKAVFSGSTDDMSKTQKTFIKRIVAAILVFIAPIFVNLILFLANEVWENISTDSCIEQSK